jgi:hypothetical protein
LKRKEDLASQVVVLPPSCQIKSYSGGGYELPKGGTIRRLKVGVYGRGRGGKTNHLVDVGLVIVFLPNGLVPAAGRARGSPPRRVPGVPLVKVLQRVDGELPGVARAKAGLVLAVEALEADPLGRGPGARVSAGRELLPYFGGAGQGGRGRAGLPLDARHRLGYVVPAQGRLTRRGDSLLFQGAHDPAQTVAPDVAREVGRRLRARLLLALMDRRQGRGQPVPSQTPGEARGVRVPLRRGHGDV